MDHRQSKGALDKTLTLKLVAVCTPTDTVGGSRAVRNGAGVIARL